MTAYVVVCSDADDIHSVEPFKQRAGAELHKASEAAKVYEELINEFGECSETDIEVRRGCARVSHGNMVWRWSVHKIKI